MKIKVRQNSKAKIFLFLALAGILLFKSAPAYATLVSSDTEDTARAKSVLVSSESKIPDLDFVVRPETDRSRDVLISWEDSDFSDSFIVRPQARKSGGALVSRPAELDLKILNIISQAKIASLSDYSQWLSENIEYRPEEVDAWAGPEETLARRYGDCEDFAFLNALVVRIFGYEPKVLGIIASRISPNHAVCVFEKKGEYFMFDNTALKQTPASSLEELGRYLIRSYLCAFVLEINIEDAGLSLAAPDLGAREGQAYE